ncbi:MAG: 23S rRNA (uracil(1939)-C(5))-methyltransferase RlmD [Clostridia bacterium]|nr:23S rRNA (uracil(1939)-C(5))-methyltransferase RlmD [Clostridia bacterium]
MLNKNDTVRLTVESVDGMMNGVAHFEGRTVFVPGALTGEEITALIVKCAPSYAFGKLLAVENANPERVDPPCPYYKACGGCSALHMRYEASLRVKQDAVRQTLRRIGGVEIDVPLPLGMDEPFHYRNKTAMPVENGPDGPRSGFYAPRSHRLVPVDRCLIAMEPADRVTGAVLSWMQRYNIPAWDENSRTGLIRHILSRVSQKGEVMAVVTTSKEELPEAEALCECLRRETPGLVSVCQSVNPRGDNVILGRDYRVLWGSPRLRDTLCGFTFSLSPLSFFQVNPRQTERLYETALRFAAPQPEERAVDLYCGAGTISLLLSKYCREVTGIEIVPQAVRDARENARQNGVSNARFYAGAAEKLLPELVKKGLRPDLAVLDPPRKGAEPEVLWALAEASPARVVYVSCDPATLARDIKVLSDCGYVLQKVQPVDMFCFSQHIENVALLTRASASS